MEKILFCVSFLILNIWLTDTSEAIEKTAEKDCAKNMVESTIENTFPVPADLWEAAKNIIAVKEEISPPTIILSEFKDKNSKRIGCIDYKRWVIQIATYPDTSIREYFIMHELAHALLYRSGKDYRIHHCIFFEKGLEHSAIKWLIENGRTFQRGTINDIYWSALRSYISCQEDKRKSNP